MAHFPTEFQIFFSDNRSSKALFPYSNPTFAFNVDFCWKTSSVIGVLQRAQKGRLCSRHGEQHHQYGTQNVALHHLHRIMELLLEQSLAVSLNQFLK